jgi:arginine-tRNA-protein transferase
MHGFVYPRGSCSYLPDREAHTFFLAPSPASAPPYRELMDQRFRRSGSYFYRPACPACEACQPIRVDIARFQPRKEQRRCGKRNIDLTVIWQERGLDPDRLALFQRYEHHVHERLSDLGDAAELMWEDGGVAGGEFHARDARGTLIAVSIVDRFNDALSSVYCYYDPDQPRRSLGTFMVLSEIEFCRKNQLDWLYLGFLVRGCRKMEYKARFLPHEVLEHGEWVRYREPQS